MEQPSLVPGQELGPYQITSLLAYGGMGEVYRARDARLGRLVAIKVLSPRLTAGSQALERFQREARAASTLNHPNICTIHDVGTDPPFIAMELLEGETLHERLRRGPIDLKSFFDIALAVLDGLVAAHTAGITHRDVKPANLFLTTHGPKILDFGLAKSQEEEPGAASYEPTQPPHTPLTQPGVAVGTVAYMSPEQLRGEPVDARTDLFSLGLVLYEMATGRPAFTGPTNAVVSAAILDEAPRSPREIRSDLPVRLEELLLRTLEKDRDLRFQTAADLRAELKRLKRELDAHQTTVNVGDAAPSGLTASPSTTGTGMHNPRSAGAVAQSSDAQLLAALVTRHRIGIVAASVVMVLAAAGGFYVIRELERARPDPSSIASISLENLTVSQLTTSGKAQRATISPDGKYVAYIEREADQYSLWIRQPATASTVQIVPPERGVVLRATSITPDGAFVDFVRGYELWRIPFLGGVARRLLERVDSGIGWSPDGRRMAFLRANWPTNQSWLFVADSDGSNERAVATRRGVDGFFNVLSFPTVPNVHPAWSPGGGVLAVSALFANGPGLLFVDPATRAEQTVPIEGLEHGMDWMDEGTLVFSLLSTSGSSQLWKASYPDGRISRLTNDVNSYSGVSLTSDRNELVTTRTERRVGIAVGEAGAPNTNDVVPPAPNPGAALAWAGDRVLYTTAAGTIMSFAPDRGAPSLVVEAAAQPTATSDGGTIVFNRFTTRGAEIWKADADGRNPTWLGANGFHAAITRDNKYVLYGGPTLSMIPIAGGAPTVLVDSFAGFIDTSLNGTSILVTTGEEPKVTVTLCELPACTARRTLTPMPAPSNLLRTRFVPSGEGSAYIDAATQANVWVQPLDGTASRQLTHFNDGRVIDDFAWSPDGKRLAVARATVTNDIILFKGLRNSPPRQ